MTLTELNALNPEQAQDWFMQTCAAQSWCHAMTNARPFASTENIISVAETVWQSCSKPDFLQAFEAHPMIGDVNSLREKFKNTQAMASHEQSGAQAASEDTLQQLHELNHSYLEKHGFIFIIFATGKSADEMLASLKERIVNDTDTEIQNAAAEQIKITQLRINKNLLADQSV